MTREEWEGLTYVLANAWPGEFDRHKEAAYFALVGDLERHQVEAALRRLAERGGSYRPSAADLRKAAVAVGRPARPTWTEVWPAIDHVTSRLDEERGLVRLAELAGPYAVAFVMTKGWKALGQMELACEDYGALNVKRLGEEFERWADAIDERVRSGLSLEQATVARSLTRGPRRVDALAALGIGNTNQMEDHQ